MRDFGLAKQRKIVTISDIHIRNFKYWDKYRKTFDNLFVEVKKQNPSLIVFTGDLFHTKSSVTGESISLAKYLFSGLTSIAPVHIILGNHDCLQKNKDRISAVLPIVEEFENLFLYTKSGFYPVNGTDIVFAVFSILEENKFTFNVEDLEKEKIYIALFHGMINGSSNKNGHVFTHGEDASIFNGLDFAFLGDIHEMQKIDDEGRAWYSGALIQNNHGESYEKGFLVWDIKSKNEWTVDFIQVDSPLKFTTIELDKDGTIPANILVSSEAQLRLVSNSNLPLDVVKKALEDARKRFGSSYVTYFCRNIQNNENGKKFLLSSGENLRDARVQERLIREYLKKYELEEGVVQNILKLNKKYSVLIEKDADVARNTRWELLNVEWDNLFNYGEKNRIDFTSLRGVTGIFGKNFIGKTSAVETILFVLFNNIAKKSRKSLNIINQNKDWAFGKVEVLVGREKYIVQRRMEKYEKTLKGEISIEAKTDLDFSSINLDTGAFSCHNGASRQETDKNLRKVFGSLEDFLLISMSDQMESLSFIKEGSTKRKEILVKFLDLNVFTEKYGLAKEESVEIKNFIKELSSVNYEEEIEKQKRCIKRNKKEIEKQKEECEKIKLRLAEAQKESFEIENFIKSVKHEFLDKEEIENKIETLVSYIKKEEIGLKEEKQTLQGKKEKIKKMKAFFDSDFDIEKCKKEKELIDNKVKELEKKQQEERALKISNEKLKKKIEILGEVPCGKDYKNCKFIKDAYESKTILEQEEKVYEKCGKNIESLKNSISELNYNGILEQIGKYENLVKLNEKINYEVKVIEFEIFKKEAFLKQKKDELNIQEKNLARFHENKIVLEEVKLKKEKKLSLEKEIGTIKKEIEKYDNDIAEIYKQLGFALLYLPKLEEKEQELFSKKEDLIALDYFLSCMHINGISNEIIKSKLPLINDEIQKVLANVVKFQVFLELEDNKLEINIKFPKFDARKIDMGSGAEHHLTSIAIRLAFLSVTNLPISDIIIFDEPAVHLDEENLEGFTRILEMIKDYFKCVILITHLDQLKDCADNVLTIEKNKEGYSRLFL